MDAMEARGDGSVAKPVRGELDFESMPFCVHFGVRP